MKDLQVDTWQRYITHNWECQKQLHLIKPNSCREKFGQIQLFHDKKRKDGRDPYFVHWHVVWCAAWGWVVLTGWCETPGPRCVRGSRALTARTASDLWPRTVTCGAERCNKSPLSVSSCVCPVSTCLTSLCTEELHNYSHSLHSSLRLRSIQVYVAVEVTGANVHVNGAICCHLNQFNWLRQEEILTFLVKSGNELLWCCLCTEWRLNCAITFFNVLYLKFRGAI